MKLEQKGTQSWPTSEASGDAGASQHYQSVCQPDSVVVNPLHITQSGDVFITLILLKLTELCLKWSETKIPNVPEMQRKFSSVHVVGLLEESEGRIHSNNNDQIILIQHIISI